MTGDATEEEAGEFEACRMGAGRGRVVCAK